MKAFIFDPLWDDLVTDDLLQKLKTAGLEVVVTKEVAPLSDCKELFTGSEERILCLNPDYVSWKLASDDYKDIPSLKGIMIASTGFDWVDTSLANERNIPVCQIVGFSAEAVAEWAIMTTLNLARQTPRLIKDGFPLDYDKDFMRYRGVELHGKTAGIIGMGRIGRAIAKRCAGLGMEVIYWSRHSRVDEYKYEELAKIMSTVDVVFPITAKNEETRALFTPELIASIKPTAILVQEAEGLVDHEALLKMVADSKLYGYGFETGPAEFKNYEGNVWAAPAYGWATDNSMYLSVERWTENMVSAKNGTFPNRVN